MQAVVLAAGTGSRLKDLTRALPKALIPVNGRPLLTYALGFARAVGCEQIVVVTGAFREKVEQLLARVQGLPGLAWVHNPDFLKGNLYSLGAARPKLGGAFLLLNTDHVYHRELAARVRAQCRGLTAFCDQDRQLGADDMKVRLDPQGRLAAIAKTLTEFQRGYVGMTFCPAERRQDYWRAFDQVAAEQGDKAVVEQVLARLAAQGAPAEIGDISGPGWLEIDTQDERQRAEQAIQTRPQDYLAAEVSA
ncbi:MAG TPA: NTP transferase domain-containing protein [Myxococcota bacterium]|nr:NTP transferase domain-containing protein [Myxococcota bacterium]HRY94011.1 NTP transferase domain-containing protein [Myxococcota bacterium]HSA24441.1 NTP transferase domain-containing protein [Myxococcota bacterium]